FMAGRAFSMSLCRRMTRHARAHIVHHLFGDHIALANQSMAGLTRCARLSVHTVAEVDESREPVDADPWNWPLLLRGGSYLPNVRAVTLYGLVTVHAETLRRISHKFARIRILWQGLHFSPKVRSVL